MVVDNCNDINYYKKTCSNFIYLNSKQKNDIAFHSPILSSVSIRVKPNNFNIVVAFLICIFFFYFRDVFFFNSSTT